MTPWRAGLPAVVALVAFGAAAVRAQAPPPGETPSAAASTPVPCSSARHHEFDFWIGLWSVIDGDGRFAGVNEISRVAGGCVLQERWASGRGGFSGTSLNWFSTDGRWHQTWIDSLGQELQLAGGLVDGRMVLEGVAPQGADGRKPPQQRITWSREGEGRVRQRWEMSADGGRMWVVAFDGVYHPVARNDAPLGGILARLAGDWIGSGEIMNQSVQVTLTLHPLLNGRFMVLEWTNLGPAATPQLFEGAAVYEAAGADRYRASWWDSQGTQHAVEAVGDATSLTANWGEKGRTVYSLLPGGELEVVDSVRSKDGTWREFGRSRLVRQ